MAPNSDGGGFERGTAVVLGANFFLLFFDIRAVGFALVGLSVVAGALLRLSMSRQHLPARFLLVCLLAVSSVGMLYVDESGGRSAMEGDVLETVAALLSSAQLALALTCCWNWLLVPLYDAIAGRANRHSDQIVAAATATAERNFGAQARTWLASIESWTGPRWVRFATGIGRPDLKPPAPKAVVGVAFGLVIYAVYWWNR